MLIPEMSALQAQAGSSRCGYPDDASVRSMPPFRCYVADQSPRAVFASGRYGIGQQRLITGTWLIRPISTFGGAGYTLQWETAAPPEKLP